ncbi:MAG: hypothetical protein LAT55_10730 [Opitutales bacterium]|nr:hypothetical protein [Opitutales bacterium]
MDQLITSFGACADSDFKNTQAIQQAIDEVAKAGGRVIVPPGVWRTGMLQLRSHVELHLQRGAVLLGTNDPEDYPSVDVVEKGILQSRRAFDRRMIFGCEVEDVAVTGPGTIDGNGGCADTEFSRGAEGRPNNIQFVASRRVTVEGLHLRCAGSWMMQVLACEDVSLSGLRIWNHGNKTNDGMDIDGSRDVRIQNCSIDSHDDALVFKSTGPKSCREIVVSNCTLRSNCHGIKFGTESVGGFENIRVANCLIGRSRKPSPMAGYPQGRPSITGCALECTDGGTMRNISISGLVVEEALAPIFIKLGNRHDRRIPGEDFQGTGKIENIHIDNILARQVGPFCCSVTGMPEEPIRGVQLSNLQISFEGGLVPEKILSEVPENNADYPEINMFGGQVAKKAGKVLPAWGFFFRHVQGLSVQNCQLTCRKPDPRSMIVKDQVTSADG